MQNKKKAFRRLLACATVAVSLCLLVVGVNAIARKSAQDKEPVRRSVDRAAKIAELRTTLQDQQLQISDPERVEQAIVQLGEERAVEAVPDLIQLLTFKRKMPWEKHPGGERAGELSMVTPGSRYPAVTALYQIGEPSLPALVEVIGQEETNSEASRNARYALTGIFRVKFAEGIKHLKDAAARSNSPDRAQRLLEAAREMEKLMPDKRKP